MIIALVVCAFMMLATAYQGVDYGSKRDCITCILECVKVNDYIYCVDEVCSELCQ
jgi:hypothetical protein